MLARVPRLEDVPLNTSDLPTGYHTCNSRGHGGRVGITWGVNSPPPCSEGAQRALLENDDKVVVILIEADRLNSLWP